MRILIFLFFKVQKWDIVEGIDHVRRLMALSNKARVWKNRYKLAEVEVQIFLTTCIVKPFTDLFV